MTAMPRLPDPLTPETIEPLMKARPYWDTSHPQSPLYRRLVQRGFEIMYPGPLRRDAIGRQIDTKPLKPQYIAHLVAKENREMDELERVINGEAARDGGFDERPSGEGVHVQSHTRDGGKTEVADYWRARPGEGGGNDKANDGVGADDKSDDDLPPGGSPVDTPRIRGRDGYGEGDYNVSRGEDAHGKQKIHKGVDLITEPGETVRSPVTGTVLPPFDPYRSDPELRDKLSAVQIKTDDGHIVEILYVDPKSSGLKPGDKVEIGTPIGKAQDLAPVYPPRKSGAMTNHIDVRIKKDGVYKDPTPLIFGRR